MTILCVWGLLPTNCRNTSEGLLRAAYLKQRWWWKKGRHPPPNRERAQAPSISKYLSKDLGFSHPWSSLVLTDTSLVKMWVPHVVGTLATPDPWTETFGEFSYSLICYTWWVIFNLPMPRLHDTWFQLVGSRAQPHELLEAQATWMCCPWWSPSMAPSPDYTLEPPEKLGKILVPRLHSWPMKSESSGVSPRISIV